MTKRNSNIAEQKDNDQRDAKEMRKLKLLAWLEAEVRVEKVAKSEDLALVVEKDRKVSGPRSPKQKPCYLILKNKE